MERHRFKMGFTSCSKRLLTLLAILLLPMPVKAGYALVGTIGTATQGTSGASVTPAWGTGESRTAGNLLVLFASVTGTATSLSVPSGWNNSSAVLGTSCSSYVYTKTAAGGDAAPTITGVTSGLIAAQLAEFSGGDNPPARDKFGNNTGTSSPLTATFSTADAQVGEILLISTADFRSTARASNDTLTSNHGTVTQAGNNNGTSSVNHYSFGYVLATTSNTGGTSATMTLSITTSITGLAIAAVTFTIPFVPDAHKGDFLPFFQP